MNSRHSAQCTMAFGRYTKTAGACLRCDALKAGAKPVKGWGAVKREQERKLSEAIRNHVCSESCGIVCTRFEW